MSTPIPGVTYTRLPGRKVWEAPGRPSLPGSPDAPPVDPDLPLRRLSVLQVLGSLASVVAPPEPGMVLAGSLPLGDAAYPVPAGARFVAPTGSDTAAGTLAEPWQTLNHARAQTPSGGTIVLRGGTYREGGLAFGTSKTLTVQPYYSTGLGVSEQVTFDGSRPATSWTDNGDGTWSTPYTLVLRRFTPQNGPNPLRNHVDQCWINGAPQRLVAATATPTAGQFKVDQAAGRLTIGTNPAGRTVDVSNLRTLAMCTGVTNWLGVRVRRYSPDGDNGNMEWLNAPLQFAGSSAGSLVEHCIIEDSSLDGIAANRRITLRNVTVRGIGHSGMLLTYFDSGLVDRCVVEDWNQKGWQAEPACAGIKVTRAYAPRVTASYFRRGPDSYAVWMDVSCAASVVDTCDIVGDGTMKRGIEVELSDGGTVYGTQDKTLIVGNRIRGCTASGILFFDSGHGRTWNNDIAGCGTAIYLWQDRRQNPNAGDNSDTRWSQSKMPWHTVAHEVCNNAIVQGGSLNLQLIAYDDGGTLNLRGADMLARLAGNWLRPSPPGTAVQLGRAGGARTNYHSQAALAAAGTDVGGPLGSKLGPNHFATTAPDVASVAEPLPAAVAALLGIPAGNRHIGVVPARLPVRSAA